MALNTKLHYKDDSTFLHYLAMSYVGESTAIELMRAYGHEFEFDGYGAGSVEIYKDVFCKQKRTPDLRCRRCGQKLEVRAKSNLKIAMSHSASRPFDKELAAEDWVGFVRVVLRENDLDKTDPRSYRAPTEIYVISVAELSAKQLEAKASVPKSEDKGSEKYLIWPTLLSPIDGEILDIRRYPSVIEIKAADGQIRNLTPPSGSFLYNGIGKGGRLRAKETLICGIAKTLREENLRCCVND